MTPGSTTRVTVHGDVGTLNVRASQLAQAESLTVRNNATIDAAAVDLNHQANDFQGRLSLNVAGDAQVADTNSLRVAGNVNTAIMNASTLIVDGLAAQGNVTFNAASTGQSGVLSVAGASAFNGDSIALDSVPFCAMLAAVTFKLSTVSSFNCT